MSYDPVSGKWSVTTDLTAGEFKFRANNDWGLNYGGDLNNLAFDGSNINVPIAGNYTVTLDFSNSEQFKGTLVKN